jgi:Ca2+/Na+ antiporter
MSLKQLIITVLGAALIAWASWLFILFEVDPTASGNTGVIFFYLSLFIALWGTLFVVFSLIKKKFNKDDLEHNIVKVSFRQSIFFSLTVVGVLFLQSRNFLTWWNLILLILGVSLLEYLFLSFKRTPHEDKEEDRKIPPYIPLDF